jgi:hypothetical protein
MAAGEEASSGCPGRVTNSSVVFNEPGGFLDPHKLRRLGLEEYFVLCFPPPPYPGGAPERAEEYERRHQVPGGDIFIRHPMWAEWFAFLGEIRKKISAQEFRAIVGFATSADARSVVRGSLWAAIAQNRRLLRQVYIPFMTLRDPIQFQLLTAHHSCASGDWIGYIYLETTTLLQGTWFVPERCLEMGTNL